MQIDNTFFIRKLNIFYPFFTTSHLKIEFDINSVSIPTRLRYNLVR